METNKIIITNEDGMERELNILFTFEIENKKYVLVYEDENEDELIPLSFDDEGNLFYIEDEEELNMIEEVLGAFEDEEYEN